MAKRPPLLAASSVAALMPVPSLIWRPQPSRREICAKFSIRIVEFRALNASQYLWRRTSCAEFLWRCFSLPASALSARRVRTRLPRAAWRSIRLPPMPRSSSKRRCAATASSGAGTARASGVPATAGKPTARAGDQRLRFVGGLVSCRQSWLTVFSTSIFISTGITFAVVDLRDVHSERAEPPNPLHPGQSPDVGIFLSSAIRSGSSPGSPKPSSSPPLPLFFLSSGG